MRFLLMLACLVLLISHPARAQQESVATSADISSGAAAAPSEQAASSGGAAAEGEVIADPVCFNVINKAPYNVFGTFITNFYTTDDGVRARHRSNFRLQTSEKAEFCTYGPFYEGRRLELVLRTLVPVFSCKTMIDEDIVIYGRRKAEGGTDTWAVCK